MDRKISSSPLMLTQGVYSFLEHDKNILEEESKQNLI
jgi:hypothetical protein